MHLFIIRHGKAHTDSPSGNDADRALRKRGFKQAFYLADQFASMDHKPSEIISSTAVRARDTARTIASALGLELLHDDRLTVDMPAGKAIELITEKQDVGCLALAGHNFQVSDVVNVLTQTQTPPLRTGECVVLDVSDPANPVGSTKELARIRLNED